MFRAHAIVPVLVPWLLWACSSPPPQQTGFLTDYSRLAEMENGKGVSWLDPYNRLARFSRFRLAELRTHFYADAEGTEVDRSVLTELEDYMRRRLTEELSKGYEVVDYEAPDVAELRIALSDLRESDVVLSATPLRWLGIGTGAASMEAEILDPRKGDQIAAVVLEPGTRTFAMHGLDEWRDAMAAMDGWAVAIREVVDEAHAARRAWEESQEEESP